MEVSSAASTSTWNRERLVPPASCCSLQGCACRPSPTNLGIGALGVAREQLLLHRHPHRLNQLILHRAPAAQGTAWQRRATAAQCRNNVGGQAPRPLCSYLQPASGSAQTGTNMPVRSLEQHRKAATAASLQSKTSPAACHSPDAGSPLRAWWGAHSRQHGCQAGAPPAAGQRCQSHRHPEVVSQKWLMLVSVAGCAPTLRWEHRAPLAAAHQEEEWLGGLGQHRGICRLNGPLQRRALHCSSKPRQGAGNAAWFVYVIS